MLDIKISYGRVLRPPVIHLQVSGSRVLAREVIDMVS